MNTIAFVFPGQGAQYPGMGKDFHDTFDDSRKIFEEASDLLHMDMNKLCFEENEKLNQTEYTQAAMITVSAAILKQVRQFNISPTLCAGLSLGEYSALMSCGSISFPDALKVVRERGLLMQHAVPENIGGMYAILGSHHETINSICLETKGIVSIANYNYPGQTVITGEKKALEKAKDACLKAGASKAVPMKVSGPFHSPLLVSAGERLREYLNQVDIRAPLIPYISNVNAQCIHSELEIRELLAIQVYSPVLWLQSIESMIQMGIDTFIEIGPKKTLSSMIRKINSNVQTLTIEKTEDLQKLLEVKKC